jgi:hypothetical protein
LKRKKIPIDQKVSELASYYGVPEKFLAGRGEEFQLLFTSSLPDSIFYKSWKLVLLLALGLLFRFRGGEMFRLSVVWKKFMRNLGPSMNHRKSKIV